MDDCSGGSEGNCKHEQSGICAWYTDPQTRMCPVGFVECGLSTTPTSSPATTSEPTPAPASALWAVETVEVYFATNAVSNPTVGCGFLSDAAKVQTFDDSFGASLVAACNKANTQCRMINMTSACGSIISTVMVEWAGTGSFRDVILVPAVTAREITGDANGRTATVTEVFPRLETVSVLVQSNPPVVLTDAQAAEVAVLLVAGIAADIGLDPARLGNQVLTPQLGDASSHLLQFLVTMETGADQLAYPAVRISVANLVATGGVSAVYQSATGGEVYFQSALGANSTSLGPDLGAGTADDDGGVSDSTLYILVIVIIVALGACLLLAFFVRRRQEEHQNMITNTFTTINGIGASEKQFLSADGSVDLERWWGMTDGKGSAAALPVGGGPAAGWSATGRAHFYPGAVPDARSTGSSPEEHGGYFPSHKLGLSEFDGTGMSNAHYYPENATASAGASNAHYYPENAASSDAWLSGGGPQPPLSPTASSGKATSAFITMARAPGAGGSAEPSASKWKLWSPTGSVRTEVSPSKAKPAPVLDGQALMDFRATSAETIDAELNRRQTHRGRPELDESVAADDDGQIGPTGDLPGTGNELTSNVMFRRRSSNVGEEPVQPNELTANKIFRGRASQDNGDPQTHDWAGNPLPADLVDPPRRRRSVTPTRPGSRGPRQAPMSARQAPMSSNPGVLGSPSPLLDALRSFDDAVAQPASAPDRDSPDEFVTIAAALTGAAQEAVPVPMLFAESDDDEEDQ